MSTAGFNPTVRLLNPPDPPDYLSNAVLQSLSRPPLERHSWGAFATFLLGGLSFGILPLLWAMRRHKQAILTERDQLHHLSEWMKLQCGENAHPLTKSPEEIDRGIRLAYLIAIVSAFFALWIVVSHLTRGGSYLQLLDFVYEHPRRGRWYGPSTEWLKWLGPTLLLGQLSHWTMGLVHSVNARQFVRRFNEVAVREGFAPVAMPDISFGLRPLWIFGAIIFLVLGAPWAAVMMLAGASQRRYIRHSGMRMRLALAQRVREVMTARKPLAAVPVSATLRHRCRDEKCRAPLPAPARFCPRCGRRVTEEVNRVA